MQTGCSYNLYTAAEINYSRCVKLQMNDKTLVMREQLLGMVLTLTCFGEKQYAIARHQPYRFIHLTIIYYFIY